MNKQTLLLVEDEQSIADALIFALEQENYQVLWCQLASEALESFNHHHIDLAILDIGLPDSNGFDLCKAIKAKVDLPIIFLTARQEEVDKLIGLEIGGDDYITKPFSLREVCSRIKVILKRYHRIDSQHSLTPTPILTNCFVDDDKMEVVYFKQGLELTRYEFLLFKTLIQNPNRVFSRENLMNRVWNEPERSFERAVDTHIKTLRAKLKKINHTVQPIKTHHGLGYSFNDKDISA